MTQTSNTRPMRFVRKAQDASDVPVGSLVETPTGAHARVVGYRGFRRGHRVWLVCRYINPTNKRFDTVQLLPELVKVLEEEKAHGT